MLIVLDLSSIAFQENLYAVIARSEATKQSQQGSQTTSRDCFVNARNDNFLMKRYTSEKESFCNEINYIKGEVSYDTKTSIGHGQ